MAHRCQVEVRDRFSGWIAATEDLGPLGCQLVTPRVTAPGRELRLRIHCDAIGQTIEVGGRVVWSHAETPARLGVQFQAPPAAASWFEALLAAEPRAAAAARRLPDHLPPATVLRLGQPPIFIADFSAEEVAVLRRVGAGITLEALARQLGSAFERVRGSIFSLLARRLLVLDATEGVAPARWSDALASAERSLAAAGVRLPAPTVGPGAAGGRSAAAQKLFDEGIAHLSAGRMEVAVSRLREARRLAPADPLIAGALQRLAPWALREADPQPRSGAFATVAAAAAGPRDPRRPTG